MPARESGTPETGRAAGELTPARLRLPSQSSAEEDPPFDHFVEVIRPIVERYPDRVLWAPTGRTPNMEHRIPNDGQLVDILPRLAPTLELRRKLLVENPMRLYWAEERS